MLLQLWPRAKIARQLIAMARKRAHQVREHWRMDWRPRQPWRCLPVAKCRCAKRLTHGRRLLKPLGHKRVTAAERKRCQIGQPAIGEITLRAYGRSSRSTTLPTFFGTPKAFNQVSESILRPSGSSWFFQAAGVFPQEIERARGRIQSWAAGRRARAGALCRGR
jgi:hypothetical protein